MANSVDPDQKTTDLDLHCLQKGISGFSRTRVKLYQVGTDWNCPSNEYSQDMCKNYSHLYTKVTLSSKADRPEETKMWHLIRVFIFCYSTVLSTHY